MCMKISQVHDLQYTSKWKMESCIIYLYMPLLDRKYELHLIHCKTQLTNSSSFKLKFDHPILLFFFCFTYFIIILHYRVQHY